jgi:hypothetical protein
MPKRPFSKLKKHGPTNLYMLYPMAQSIARACVEIDKEMPLRHCPLSLEIHCPFEIILAFKFYNFEFKFSKIDSFFLI